MRHALDIPTCLDSSGHGSQQGARTQLETLEIVDASGLRARPIAPLAPSSYPPLPTGRHAQDGPDAREVAANQRARLHGALIEALAERRYEDLRMRELVRRAGVSKTTFYEHYSGGVHDCFIAVFQQVADALSERLVEAWFAGDTLQQQIALVVTAFAETVAHEPVAARLALCEPFAAGASGIEAKRAADESLRELLAAGLKAHEVRPAPIVLEGLLAGLGSIARARLFAGRERQLSEQASKLVRWTCCCLQTPAPVPAAEGTGGAQLGFRPSIALLARVGRRTESVRVRILAATLALVAERTYSAVSERDIRCRAQVSCREFQEHFSCKHAAFIGALESMWARALRHATEVGRTGPDWPRGLALGLAAMMSSLAADPVFARLAFTEMSSASGRRGVHEGTRLAGGAALQLRRSAPRQMRPSAVAAEASVAAGWAIAHHYIAEGRHRELPKLTPTLAFIALAPAIGPRAAGDAIAAMPVGQARQGERPSRAIAEQVGRVP